MKNFKNDRMNSYWEAADESFDLVNSYLEQIKVIRRKIQLACGDDDEDMAKGLLANMAQTHLRLAIALLSMSVEEEVTEDLQLPNFLLRENDA